MNIIHSKDIACNSSSIYGLNKAKVNSEVTCLTCLAIIDMRKGKNYITPDIGKVVKNQNNQTKGEE